MKRRRFLGLIGAAVAAPVVAKLPAEEAVGLVTGEIGTVDFGTRVVPFNWASAELVVDPANKLS